MKILKVFFCCLVFVLAGTFSLNAQTYDNSASDVQAIPEVIWADPTGGGTWKTEIQICNRWQGSGNTEVYVYFDYAGSPGGTTGSFLIHTFTGNYQTYKWGNFLSYLQSIDPGFNYYNRVGRCEFYANNSDNIIFVTARTVNGNYSKTMQGLNYVDSNTVEFISGIDRAMAVMNLSNDSTYRAAQDGSTILVQISKFNFVLQDPGAHTAVNFSRGTLPPTEPDEKTKNRGRNR